MIPSIERMTVQKIKCKTCANRVGADYCTMNKTMHVNRYKSCDGYKEYMPKPKPRITETAKPREQYSLCTAFGRFMLKGGHYSVPRCSHEINPTS